MNEEMEKLIGRIKEVVRVMKKRERREGGRGWREGECNRKEIGGEDVGRMFILK